MKASEQIRFRRLAVMFVFAAGLVCVLATLPAVNAVARTRPTVEMGDPDVPVAKPGPGPSGATTVAPKASSLAIKGANLDAYGELRIVNRWQRFAYFLHAILWRVAVR